MRRIMSSVQPAYLISLASNLRYLTVAEPLILQPPGVWLIQKNQKTSIAMPVTTLRLMVASYFV